MIDSLAGVPALLLIGVINVGIFAVVGYYLVKQDQMRSEREAHLVAALGTCVIEASKR